LQSVVVHIAEVDEMDASTLCDAAAPDWRPAHQSGAPTEGHVTVVDAIQTAVAAAAAPAPTRAAHWRRPLPSLLQTSEEVVAMSDSAGWITYANANTSRLFREPRERAIGTVLGLAYDFGAPAPGPHRLALFDALTGLPTPVHLSDLFACMMSRSQGSRTAVPIVALDLQGLRTMNELCGPAMSDEVLNVVGSELRFGAAGCGMIARVGEDDILLVLPEPSDPADAAVNVRGNRRSAGANDAWVDDSAMASVPQMESLPVVARPAQIASPSPILRAGAGAELPSINTAPAAESRPPVEEGLDDALRRDAIGVHYQPQFDLQSGRGCGVEALARWSLASGINVAPAIFIPVAERSGMIDTLGASVLRSACETIAGWRGGRDAERLTVSVNVSTLQINQKFFKVLSKILETSGLEPRRLELEIAEAAVIENSQLVAQSLKQWKQLGVRVAVNHAGTNYSSLGYLSRLPIDRLKLDRSLIQGMTLDDKAAGVIHAMISLGAALAIDVIAEGVETEQQFQLLTHLGCRQVQGYLLGRPMPALQAQVALRKPWGNLPKTVLRPQPAVRERRAS
jgi:EAL domain-containing protein (putative c-di-GMP-specific phosphodiesterase class I)/GGDEF domain-containing protein